MLQLLPHGRLVSATLAMSQYFYAEKYLRKRWKKHKGDATVCAGS